MRLKHRSPVVAMGALCLVACLSLLPATSGAFPIRWNNTGDTLPGDPDSPDGGNVVFKIPFSQLSLRMFVLRSPLFFIVAFEVNGRDQLRTVR
jgi:hypothetical protein